MNIYVFFFKEATHVSCFRVNLTQHRQWIKMLYRTANVNSLHVSQDTVNLRIYQCSKNFSMLLNALKFFIITILRRYFCYKFWNVSARLFSWIFVTLMFHISKAAKWIWHVAFPGYFMRMSSKHILCWHLFYYD